MSVTKGELVRINERLQATIRMLLHENEALRADVKALSDSLNAATVQLQALNRRYRRLTDYTRRLRDWLSANAARK